MWRSVATNAAIGLRAVPELEGARTGDTLQPGAVFAVSEELRGADGTLFLRLADGRGWAFEGKPGEGTVCMRHT